MKSLPVRAPARVENHSATFFAPILWNARVATSSSRREIAAKMGQGRIFSIPNNSSIEAIVITMLNIPSNAMEKPIYVYCLGSNLGSFIKAMLLLAHPLFKKVPWESGMLLAQSRAASVV